MAVAWFEAHQRQEVRRQTDLAISAMTDKGGLLRDHIRNVGGGDGWDGGIGHGTLRSVRSPVSLRSVWRQVIDAQA